MNLHCNFKILFFDSKIVKNSLKNFVQDILAIFQKHLYRFSVFDWINPKALAPFSNIVIFDLAQFFQHTFPHLPEYTQHGVFANYTFFKVNFMYAIREPVGLFILTILLGGLVCVR